MVQYSLLFALNGGSFAIAKLLGPEGQRIGGGLPLRALALGAIIFTLLMCRDIYLFGEMMRNKFSEARSGM